MDFIEQNSDSTSKAQTDVTESAEEAPVAQAMCSALSWLCLKFVVVKRLRGESFLKGEFTRKKPRGMTRLKYEEADLFLCPKIWP